MKGLFTRWLILTVAILVAAYLIDGIYVGGISSAILTAAILGFLNAFLRPILIILTLPLNILTLGLFTFVINAFLLKLASGAISGFVVLGFWPAVFGSLIISLTNWILSSFITKSHHRPDYIDLEMKDDDKWQR